MTAGVSALGKPQSTTLDPKSISRAGIGGLGLRTLLLGALLVCSGETMAATAVVNVAAQGLEIDERPYLAGVQSSATAVKYLSPGVASRVNSWTDSLFVELSVGGRVLGAGLEETVLGVSNVLWSFSRPELAQMERKLDESNWQSLLQILNPDDPPTDPNDNRTRIEDGLNRGIEYDYDARNRVSVTRYEDATEELSQYNGDNTVSEVTDRAGNVFAYGYDAKRRMTSIELTSRSAEFDDTTTRREFDYDALDRAVSNRTFSDSSSPNFTTSMVFNSAGTRLLEDYDGEAVNVTTNTFGERNTISYPVTWAAEMDVGRDNRGFTTSLTSTGSGPAFDATFGYSASDFLKTVTFASGALVSTRELNAAREERSRSMTFGASVLAGADVGRDQDGRVNRLTRATGREDRYTYTTAERWIERMAVDVPSAVVVGSEAATDVISLNYDVSHNRTNRTDAGVSVDYTTNDLNQYGAVGALGTDYDLNGNLRRVGETFYQYDAFNQLTEVGEGTQPTAVYRYDALGQLRTREYPQTGVREEFLHDKNHLVAVLDADTGAIKRRYIYMEDAVDVPLALIAGGETYYFELDPMGSVVALVTASGQVVERVRYDEAGNPTFTDAGGAVRSGSVVNNEVLYKSRCYDPVIGLYNNRARWYSPTIGRFLQTDPLGPVDGPNLYAYALNDPVNYRDPSGLFLETVVKGAVEGARKSPTISGKIAGAVAGAIVAVIWGADVVDPDGRPQPLSLDDDSKDRTATFDPRPIGPDGRRVSRTILDVERYEELRSQGYSEKEALELSNEEVANSRRAVRTKRARKRGPKPFGTGAHNKKIKEVADHVTDGRVIAGGQRRGLPERFIETPGGYKSGRRPDILVERPDGSIYGINVGKRSRRTGAPIKRESEAIEDLEGAGIEMHFVPYN